MMEEFDRFKASPVDPQYPDWMRTFYSPVDDVHGVLMKLVNSVRTSLVIAMYGYDDDELAEAVSRKMSDSSIYCQITLDKSQAGGVHEKVLLEQHHMLDSNSVAVGTSEKSQIMHRKMVVIDGVWRVSGSTNWSTAGETKQDNELTVTNNAMIAAEARHILDLEHAKALKQMRG
jgi:PLD-like domain